LQEVTEILAELQKGEEAERRKADGKIINYSSVSNHNN
jgi:hypothetical protein